MHEHSGLTPSQPVADNVSSQVEEDKVQTANISHSVFADKQFPNDWHVEIIDHDSGDIFAAVFSGPDAEERAREYLDWQQSKLGTAGRRAA
jgi:hypothetical protein